MFKVKTNVKDNQGNFIAYVFNEMQFDSYAYTRLFTNYNMYKNNDQIMRKYGICKRTLEKWISYSDKYLAKYLSTNYPLLYIDWKKYN